MYSLSEPARTGRHPQRVDGRELPVLFHLMDVSVSHPQPSEPARPVAVETHVESLPASEEPILESQTSLIKAATDVISTGPLADSQEIAHPVSSLPIISETTEISLPPVTTAECGSESSTLDVVVAAAVEASHEQLQQVPTEVTPAAEALLSEHLELTKSPVVTPKSATSTRRKTKTSASEDWFASHGKFIAMAFVIALVGTVYLARTNRQQSADPSTAAAPPKIELTQTSVSYESSVVSQGSANKLVETVSAISDSKVDLLPPTATKPAGELAASSSAPSSDSLFVFPAKKSDERVATRFEPAATQSTEKPASQPAAAPPALTPSYPTTSNTAPVYPTANNLAPAYPTATVLQSSYPSTAAPAVAYPSTASAQPPLAPNPPLAVPSNVPPAYRSQYQPPTQPTPQPSMWSPPAGPATTSAAPPGAYQSFDNTSRGTRYERTGSGNY